MKQSCLLFLLCQKYSTTFFTHDRLCLQPGGLDLPMAGRNLSLEQFSVLLINIESGLAPAASRLWNDGVNTEALLRKLTKQDMQMAGINLGNRILIYDHFHPADPGQLLCRPSHVPLPHCVTSICVN